jgi:hypothetical protein
MRQYIVIVKVGKDHFVKYHVRDLIKFTSFIDKNFPDWRFFNVFDKEKGNQIANFTTKNRPIKSRVNDSL